MMLWADGQVSRKRTDRPQGPSGGGRGWDRLPRPRQLGKKPPVCQAGQLSPPPAGGRRAVGSSPPPRGRPSRCHESPRSAPEPRPGRPSASSDGGRVAGSSLRSRLIQWQRHPRCCSRRERRAQPSLIRPSVAPFIHSSGACELLLCTRLCAEAQDATAVGAECLSQAPEPSGPFYLQSSRHPSTLPALGLHPRRVEQRPRPRPRHSWLGEPLLSLQMSPAVTSPKGPSLGLSPGGVRGGSSSQQA